MIYKSVPRITEEISAVGLGCWQLGGPAVWEGSTKEESIKAIHAALDLGINLFDTAPIYGMGTSEEVLGEALEGKRDDVLISTKCGLVWDEQQEISLNTSGESIRKEVEASLKRLRTDRIDIYQVQWPNKAVPLEPTLEALRDLKRDGKIRYIGLANHPLADLKAAESDINLACYQGVYNVLERNPISYQGIGLVYRSEKEIQPYCETMGIPFLADSPLMQGLLRDAFEGEMISTDDNPYLEIAQQLHFLAKRIEKPLVELAVNWLVSFDHVTSALCGGFTVEHIKENVAGLEWKMDGMFKNEIEAMVRPYVESGRID